MASTRVNEIKSLLVENELAKQQFIKDIHSKTLPEWKKNSSRDGLELAERYERMLKDELQKLEELENELKSSIVNSSMTGNFKYYDIFIEVVTRGINKYKLSSSNDGYRYDLGDIIKDEWDAETLFAVSSTVMHNINEGSMQQNDKLLRFWFDTLEKSARLGFVLAQYDFGNFYANSDIRKAKDWWEKAAKQGLIDAKEKLSSR